ncbi:hypothetical protein CRYO30217_03474 [Parvicella tangerina]|uniref:Uncharacterized protein n=1 Tax=Parvicella tangerina TaxID=2829795 RepID=A0A916JQY0_9FLAO|nr:hypothetical protein CRYO30217_03474 [Parvicella tangerina]
MLVNDTGDSFSLTTYNDDIKNDILYKHTKGLYYPH